MLYADLLPPPAPAGKIVTVEERYWSKVDDERDPDRCWKWIGRKYIQGYG